jgi:hypothetical protein
MMTFSGSGIKTAAAEKSSLTLICRNDDITLSGMEWSIYRIGSFYGNIIRLEGDFAKYPVTFGDLTASEVRDAADTLETCAILDKITPVAVGMTDSNGELKFENLDDGVYIACGKTMHIGDTYYSPSALMLDINTEKYGTAVNTDAFPKYLYRTLPYEISFYNVKKFWENDTIVERPEDVTAEIYKDGELYDTVILNEENNWTFQWTDEGYCDYLVREVDISDKYTVVYRSNDTQFALVNTLKDDDYYKNYGYTVTTAVTADGGDFSFSSTTTVTGTDTSQDSNVTSSSTTPTSSVTSISSGTSVSSAVSSVSSVPVVSSSSEDKERNTTVVTDTEKLPQTGQLWWPVPVMALGGILFIGLGFRLKKDDD